MVVVVVMSGHLQRIAARLLGGGRGLDQRFLNRWAVTFKLVHLRSDVEKVCLVKTPVLCERKVEPHKYSCVFRETRLRVHGACDAPLSLSFSPSLCNQL